MHYDEIKNVLTAMLQARTTRDLMQAREVDRQAVIAKLDRGLRSIHECSYTIGKATEPAAGRILLWPMMEKFCETWEANPEGIVTPKDLESQ